LFDYLLSYVAWPWQEPSYLNAFLSPRQFVREIARERIRSSRRGIPFCVVTFALNDKLTASRSKLLGKLLLRHLRFTDEKSHNSRGGFSALLVDTPQVGGHATIDRLGALFSDHGISVSMMLKVYQPSNLDSGDHDESQHTEAIEESRRWEHEGARELSSIGVRSEASQWITTPSWQTHRSSVADRRNACSGNLFGVDLSQGDEITYGEEALSRRRTVSSLVKRCVDITGAAVALIFVGPLILFVMAIIRLTSPGPAIFRQQREGLRGTSFTIYKLRTMLVNAESSQSELRKLSHRDGPAFKIKSDPRVTRVGKILRATCIDELPQLINVLRGDMSIVGPRPLPWSESRACNPWHRRRLDVRPGLTCYWQIDKASVENFDDWMRLDLKYVDRSNIWIDATLIYRTVLVALMGRGSC